MLRRDGEIFLELGYGMADAVGKMFEQAGFHVDIYTDFDRIERILRARKQSEVASPL